MHVVGLDLNARMNQAQFGALVGVSQQAVSDLIARGILLSGGTGGEWIICYCNNLREQAAGRESLLANERAALARAQRERIERMEDEARRKLAPRELLVEVLAKTASKVAGVLDAIPGMIHRRVPSLTHDDVQLIIAEIASARNKVARMSLSDAMSEREEADLEEADLEEDDARSDASGDAS